MQNTKQNPANKHSIKSSLARPGQGVLIIFGLLYLTFVIYGSLVPLQFRYRPFGETLFFFLQLPYLELDIDSRADWVANILLFVPLAFIWNGILTKVQTKTVAVLSAIIVFFACSTLAIVIEFTQLYFPPRTVSQNDVIAETLGALMGIFFWSWKGPQVFNWLAQFTTVKSRPELTKIMLNVYLFGLFIYNVMPLDLTLSMTDLYHKLELGRVVLIPFSLHPADPALTLYNWLSDIIIWIPVGALWISISKRSTFTISFFIFLSAALLEFCQLFVYTRYSDVTDIFMATIGGIIGVWLGTRYRKRSDIAVADKSMRHGFVIWLLPAAYTIALFLIFWYPYNFDSHHAFLQEQLQALRRVPLTAYYYGSEYRAITAVLHKLLFFFPLGMLGAIAIYRTLAKRWWGLAFFSLFVAISGCSLMIELGQVFLPKKSPDLTDWFIESVGALAGIISMALYHRSTPSNSPSKS